MSTYKLREEIVAAALERQRARREKDAHAADIADRRITNAADRLAAVIPPPLGTAPPIRKS